MSKNNVVYTDAPREVDEAIDIANKVADFLPKPEQLVKKTEKEKITIVLDKRSLQAYRDYAKKHDAKYQTMINDVLKSYAEQYL